MAETSLPGTQWEWQQIQRGNTLICGVDEVGRGPLAGPVVAAAVMLPWQSASPVPTGKRENAATTEHATPLCSVPDALQALDDSKRLTASMRQRLLRTIETLALGIHVGMASPREIERLNIRQATLLAMSRAIHGLSLDAKAFVLVDGRDVPKGLPCPAQAIVRGDQVSVSIAAASIVAKETRDALMVKLAAQYPGYGWERNSGYPTKEHLRALNLMGVTEHHRRSFAPVRKVMENRSER